MGKWNDVGSVLWRRSIIIIVEVLVKERVLVDVVITNYNYADKVGRAIASVKAQTLKNFHCFVVDDGSTDNSREAILAAIGDDDRFEYVYQKNAGVANARNNGVFRGGAPYVCCLDADDAIRENFLQVCVDALEDDRSLGIAYTGLWYIKPNGMEGLSPWPPDDADPDKQLAGQNQIPCCNVARRVVWERLGGQRQRYAPFGAGEEDAEMWLRAFAYGFRAKKVTTDGLFVYSWMSGRVSGDRQHFVTNWRDKHWVKDGKYPPGALFKPANGKMHHDVYQTDTPIVSVIIPVGYGHELVFWDAVDSVDNQTFKRTETVVVWDSSNEFPHWFYKAYPHIKVIKTEEPGSGAGTARNLGTKYAGGRLFMFLDADDQLEDYAIDLMVAAWTANGGIIYSDYIMKRYENRRPVLEKRNTPQYDCELAIRQPDRSMYLWCINTTLIPREFHFEIGGFDEEMTSWEDWDYYIRMARAGKCFFHINEPLVIYNLDSGFRRKEGIKNNNELFDYMRLKYRKGDVMGCKCKDSNVNVIRASNAPAGNHSVDNAVQNSSDADFVLVQYQHPNRGQHRVIGGATGIDYHYRAGGEKFLVHVNDVKAHPHLFKPVEQNVVVGEGWTHASKIDENITAAEALADPRYDLTRVEGIDAIRQQELNARGVYSIDDLINLGINGIAALKLNKIGLKKASVIYQSARRLANE